jgi:hypothetical protein
MLVFDSVMKRSRPSPHPRSYIFSVPLRSAISINLWIILFGVGTKGIFVITAISIEIPNIIKKSRYIPDIMPKLAKKLKNECKKGTKIISHTFKIKDLQTKKIYKKDKSKKLPVIYVYEI